MQKTDMLIHAWDAVLDPAEWQDWLASADRFGVLAVNNLDPARAPVVLPAHFTVAGDELPPTQRRTEDAAPASAASG